MTFCGLEIFEKLSGVFADGVHCEWRIASAGIKWGLQKYITERRLEVGYTEMSYLLRYRAIPLEALGELPEWMGPPEARTCGGLLVYTMGNAQELALSCLLTPLQVLAFHMAEDVKA